MRRTEIAICGAVPCSLNLVAASLSTLLKAKTETLLNGLAKLKNGFGMFLVFTKFLSNFHHVLSGAITCFVSYLKQEKRQIICHHSIFTWFDLQMKIHSFCNFQLWYRNQLMYCFCQNYNLYRRGNLHFDVYFPRIRYVFCREMELMVLWGRKWMERSLFPAKVGIFVL